MDSVRPVARQALDRIDPGWPRSEQVLPALPTLAAQVGDSRPAVVQAASDALTRIGAAVVPSLIDALSGDGPVNRREFRQLGSAQILGRVGPAAREAIPALVQALASEHSFVVQAAMEALERIGPASASLVPSLASFLGHQRGSIRQAACRAARPYGSVGGRGCFRISPPPSATQTKRCAERLSSRW